MAFSPRLNLMPSPARPWVDKDGRPTIEFVQFMRAIQTGNVGPFVNAANDAAAAKGGVPVNGLYQSSGTVKIRLS